MSVDTRELVKAISIIADMKNVRVTVRQAGKGAMICATTSFVSGVLFGPAGLLIGGTAGGIIGSIITSGTFRPLSEVISNDLTDAQREKLVQHVKKAVQSTNVAMLIASIMNNASIQQAVLKTVKSFVSSELKLQIVD